MAPNRPFTALLATIVVATSLSGCFADEGGPASTTASASKTSPTSNSTVPANNTTTAPPEPPVANFTVSVFNSTDANLTVGADLIFNATNSTDPAGGELTYTWDFGDNATAEGVAPNHTYTAEGNYTVVLTVTSSVSGLSAMANQTLVVVPGTPPELTLTDASGDGSVNYLDLRTGKVTQDDEFFIITIGLAAMCPCNPVDTLFMTHFTMGKIEFEVYNGAAGAYRLWDVTNGERPAGSQVSIVGSAWVVKLPLEYMETKNNPGPWAFFAQSWIGEGQAGGVEPDDRMPNSGTVTYG